MNFYAPWIVTFAFGAIIFVVGLLFQRQERKRRAAKRAAAVGASATASASGAEVEMQGRITPYKWAQKGFAENPLLATVLLIFNLLLTSYILKQEQNFGSGYSVNVQQFGAVGNGVTSDTTAFLAAISAAQTTNPPGSVYVPSTGKNYIINTTTLHFQRNTQLSCQQGAVIQWNQTNGVAMLWSGPGTTTSYPTSGPNGWVNGGMNGCTILGNQGASDTSYLIQIGDASDLISYGMDFSNFDLYGGGYNLVFAGAANGGYGNPYMVTFHNFRIHESAHDGILSLVTTGGEANTFDNGRIFLNGYNAVDGSCAFRVGSGAFFTARWISTHFDNNSPSAGQVCVPSNGSFEGHFAHDHFEKSNGNASTDFNILETAATGKAYVTIEDTDLLENQSAATTTLSPIVFVNGTLQMTDVSMVYAAGASQTPLINLGNSVTSQAENFSAKNLSVYCTNTSVNCEIVKNTGTASGVNWSMSGTFQSGFGSATNVFSFGSGNGCQDITIGNINCTGTISSIYMQGVVLESATNCNPGSSASPATCGSASMGTVVVPTTTTTYTVNTQAVNTHSQIIIWAITDNSGLTGSPTCTAPTTVFEPETSRVAATSFSFTVPSTAGATCWNYLIFNQ